MTQFTLHSQLEADSIFVRDLGLCQLRLFNQKNVPWLILIPRRADVREVFELSTADRAQLMDEMTQASQALNMLYQPHKINIGALGNVVPQLHIHVIARFTTDPAWPAPVWGKLAPEKYSADEIASVCERLNVDSLWVTPQT